MNLENFTENNSGQSESDFKKVLWELLHTQQETYRLGNDSGETSQIGELIKKFKNGEMSGEKAMEEAERLMHAKGAWNKNDH